MATLPGLPPNPDDADPDALPVDPDDGVAPPIAPPPLPGHQPVEPPKA